MEVDAKQRDLAQLRLHDQELAQGQRWRNVLTELDLFEVSLVPHPANDQTRILSMKSAAERAPDLALETHQIIERAWTTALEAKPAATPPTLEELEAKAKALGIDEILRKSQPIKIWSFEC
jgi:hypothetical protein